MAHRYAALLRGRATRQIGRVRLHARREVHPTDLARRVLHLVRPRMRHHRIQLNRRKPRNRCIQDPHVTGVPHALEREHRLHEEARLERPAVVVRLVHRHLALRRPGRRQRDFDIPVAAALHRDGRTTDQTQSHDLDGRCRLATRRGQHHVGQPGHPRIATQAAGALQLHLALERQRARIEERGRNRVLAEVHLRRAARRGPAVGAGRYDIPHARVGPIGDLVSVVDAVTVGVGAVRIGTRVAVVPVRVAAVVGLEPIRNAVPVGVHATRAVTLVLAALIDAYVLGAVRRALHHLRARAIARIAARPARARTALLTRYVQVSGARVTDRHAALLSRRATRQIARVGLDARYEVHAANRPGGILDFVRPRVRHHRIQLNRRKARKRCIQNPHVTGVPHAREREHRLHEETRLERPAVVVRLFHRHRTRRRARDLRQRDRHVPVAAALHRNRRATHETEGRQLDLCRSDRAGHIHDHRIETVHQRVAAGVARALQLHIALKRQRARVEEVGRDRSLAEVHPRRPARRGPAVLTRRDETVRTRRAIRRRRAVLVRCGAERRVTGLRTAEASGAVARETGREAIARTRILAFVRGPGHVARRLHLNRRDPLGQRIEHTLVAGVPDASERVDRLHGEIGLERAPVRT